MQSHDANLRSKGRNNGPPHWPGSLINSHSNSYTSPLYPCNLHFVVFLNSVNMRSFAVLAALVICLSQVTVDVTASTSKPTKTDYFGGRPARRSSLPSTLLTEVLCAAGPTPPPGAGAGGPTPPPPPPAPEAEAPAPSPNGTAVSPTSHPAPAGPPGPVPGDMSSGQCMCPPPPSCAAGGAGTPPAPSGGAADPSTQPAPADNSTAPEPSAPQPDAPTNGTDVPTGDSAGAAAVASPEAMTFTGIVAMSLAAIAL
ncbi:uncharacterized protein PGTG_06679 [Puccinia graminis f. sp. tritici CRL 75-36-700-3]|uniref:Uncharacterized protein n=1 Tax=Puccinia graminis f. sp. tritici (strain CRL 75-36-700-3 / race SCCL) TaxID=418459 RepID=E3K8A5_PUCGT|nr:uncharacterized protein PGTG_06679 [Puccinia graminis f. sp. tritici CRL 75-36-700-3]EFP80723.2 hypothetical protein PGTG_06679 [Puccinia graminis f. sp. tritici CRL 75-36-700-3]